MPLVVAIVLAIVVMYGTATALPLVGRGSGGRWRGWAVGGVALVAMGCPLLIPADRVTTRAFLAVLSADLAFKVVDFYRQFGRDWDAEVDGAYRWFLAPFPLFSIVYPEHKRRLLRPDPLGPNLVRLASGVVGFAVAVGLLGVATQINVLRSNPWIDHVAKGFVFVLAVESASMGLHGLERLAGFDTPPIMRRSYRSRTVAEFWRRYNTRMHDWYDRHVFRPSGGRRRPVRSVTLSFLISGLFHELMFGIATSRFTGYQLAFFLIQAPAVLASARLERWARRGGIGAKVAAHALTILFLLATSTLFFHGACQVFPAIYAGRSPLP